MRSHFKAWVFKLHEIKAEVNKSALAQSEALFIQNMTHEKKEIKTETHFFVVYFFVFVSNSLLQCEKTSGAFFPMRC